MGMRCSPFDSDVEEMNVEGASRFTERGQFLEMKK